MSENEDTKNCLCIKCRSAREDPLTSLDITVWDFRYACEICGNKRCPHHTDHNLECTHSNEPGQAGSVYEFS